MPTLANPMLLQDVAVSSPAIWNRTKVAPVGTHPPRKVFFEPNQVRRATCRKIWDFFTGCNSYKDFLPRCEQFERDVDPLPSIWGCVINVQPNFLFDPVIVDERGSTNFTTVSKGQVAPRQ